MSYGYNSINDIKIDDLSLGICPECNKRLAAECEHSNTEEAQEWYAAYIATSQQLANDLINTVQRIEKEIDEALSTPAHKHSAGTQRLIDAGCLDANGNLIPYKSTGRRERPLSPEEVADYYGEDGFQF